MTKSHPISGPALVSPPNPSITTLPTPPAKPEGRQSRFGTTRGKAELHPDARSTFTFSVYARPYDPKPSYRSHRATYSTSSITQASDQPPRFPEIPFPSLLSVSPPVSTVGAPSRTPTVPRGAINHIHTRRVPGGEIVWYWLPDAGNVWDVYTTLASFTFSFCYPSFHYRRFHFRSYDLYFSAVDSQTGRAYVLSRLLL